jgi:hypothetical protein
MEKEKNAYQILEEHNAPFDEKMWYNSNNGVIGVCRPFRDEEARPGPFCAIPIDPQKNPVFTFSDYSNLQGCVTGTTQFLVDLIDKYDKGHVPFGLPAKRKPIYVPFSNCSGFASKFVEGSRGARIYTESNRGEEPASTVPCIVRDLNKEIKGWAKGKKENEIMGDVMTKSGIDAFTIPQAIPEDMIRAGARIESEGVFLKYPELLDAVKALQICTEETKYKTTAEQLVKAFEL